MKKNSLYIFFHTPKAAGSTFNYHIEKNFKKEERLRIGYRDLGIGPKNRNKTNYLNHIKIFLNGFDYKQIKKIRVIYGHCAAYGIHELFKKKARYFTFVRDPVSRTVSYYNFVRTIYDREDKDGRKKEFYKHQLLLNDRILNFIEWLTKKYGKCDTDLETMHQTFQMFGYLDKQITKNSIQKMLDKFYFVGLTESYDDDAAFMYGKLGINKFFVNVNKSEKHIKEPIDKVLLNKIRRINKIDLKIYEEAKKRNKKFANSKKYKVIVENIKKKETLRPIHQVIYDPIKSARFVSAWLRKKSSLYSKTLDKIKGIER